MTNKLILSVKGLTKTYTQGENSTTIFQGLNLDIRLGEIIGIIGESGSGKSTFLNLVGLLDRASEGEITIEDKRINASHNLEEVRLSYAGFIYQYHYLLQDFSAIENVILPQLIKGKSYKESKIRAKELLQQLGLEERMYCFPNTLSGGEQQRVAIARGFANNPKILLADEPTGNLDAKNADRVFSALAEAVKNSRAAALIVTHSLELAAKADRVYKLCFDCLEPVFL